MKNIRLSLALSELYFSDGADNHAAEAQPSNTDHVVTPETDEEAASAGDHSTWLVINNRLINN